MGLARWDESTDLEREIFVWCHEADALEMIVSVAGTLLLNVRRERRTAGTLAFSIVCAKRRAYRGSECTSLLLVVGRTEPSSRVTAAK